MATTLGAGEIVLWSTTFGLLIGVIWSLKYIVLIDRRMERLEEHMDKLLHYFGERSSKRRRR